MATTLPPSLSPIDISAIEKAIANLSPAEIADIEQQIGATEGALAQALITKNFTTFNADAAKLLNTILVDLETPVCFTSGTLIRTDRGEVRVEDLIVGDMVETASGFRPVTWTGSNIVNFTHPRWAKDQPVLIRKDAFGENRPYQDLLVSPGHAIKLDILGEMLTPVSALINGMTIAQQDVPHVVYWHVELESHDIIVSNGLETESYIDVGNRSFFLGEGATHGKGKTVADYCRPFRDGGVLVQAAHASLHTRAIVLGYEPQKIAEAA